MIGDRLKELRHDHNDTQEDLVGKLNISKFTVQSWEQGKSEPNHEIQSSITPGKCGYPKRAGPC